MDRSLEADIPEKILGNVCMIGVTTLSEAIPRLTNIQAPASLGEYRCDPGRNYRRRQEFSAMANGTRLWDGCGATPDKEPARVERKRSSA